jgi:hypothetical protein
MNKNASSIVEFTNSIDDVIKSNLRMRRKLVYLRRLVFVYKQNIKTGEEEILRKHCGIKPKRVFDPLTGQVNLKYNPLDNQQDYYL